MDRKKLGRRLIYLIFFILFANFFANKFYWYSSVGYFDMIMHFLGGFWIGLLYFYLFSFKENSRTNILKIFTFVLLIGLGWEVYEILVNDIVAKNSFDYLDSASDIFFDLLGGLISTFYFYKRIMFNNTNKV